eukprot:1407152-Rhodomonas_salina.2
MPGTDTLPVPYRATKVLRDPRPPIVLCARYAMSGTDLAYQPTRVLCDVWYSFCTTGTDHGRICTTGTDPGYVSSRSKRNIEPRGARSGNLDPRP